MGQQQLLLVILVTIIVGIATVVAINIFGTAADQANRDAVRQDLMSAAVQAQGIWARPTLMGGANRDFAGTHITDEQIMERLGIPGVWGNDINNPATTPSTTRANENGVYVLTSTAERQLVVTATPASGDDDMVMTVAHVADCGWGIRILDESNNQTSESGCDIP